MNPRKRRAIARAIMAGIPAGELTSERLTAFLRAEQNNLNICDAEVNTILAENAANTNTSSATKTNTANVNNTVTTTVNEPNVEDTKATTATKTKKNKLPAALQQTFSMKNTKAQLVKAAERLGVEIKSGMTKAKILSLIQSV